MTASRGTFGTELPHQDLSSCSGKLFVVEGGDGAGRSTQIQLLKTHLEGLGYPVVTSGIRRSPLLGKALADIMTTNLLCPRTLSLFYATDFFDELERVVLPALRAGFVVLVDRYIYTPIARSLVRGCEREWLENLYSMAPVPDLVLYLMVPPSVLAERIFMKKLVLDYWEAGLDVNRSEDFYSSFISYQSDLHEAFLSLFNRYQITPIDGNRDSCGAEIDSHKADSLAKRVKTSKRERISRLTHSLKAIPGAQKKASRQIEAPRKHRPRRYKMVKAPS